MLQRLPLIRASLSDEKQTLGSVKSEFKDYQNKMAAINKKITGVIQKVCKKEKQGGCPFNSSIRIHLKRKKSTSFITTMLVCSCHL